MIKKIEIPPVISNYWRSNKNLLIINFLCYITLYMSYMKLFPFVTFKPLSYCFEEIIEFDAKASFTSRPESRLMRWYNEPGDKTKEF